MKMQRHFFKILIGISLLLTTTHVYSQINMPQNQKGNWQIGVFGGIAQYYGDISDKSFFAKLPQETKFSFGLLGRRHINDNIGFGIQYSRSNLFGEKANLASTGAVFNRAYEGVVNQVAAHTYLNLTNYFWDNKMQKFSIFGTLGLGYAWWAGSMYNSQNGTVYVDAKSAAAKDFRSGFVAFPASLGAEIQLSPNIKLTIENTLLTVFSDDMDYYKDGYQYDIVSMNHIGISYFINGIRSPKAKKPKSTSRWEPEAPVSIIEYEVFQGNLNDKPKPQPLPTLVIEQQAKNEPKLTQPKAFEFRVQIYAKSQQSKSPQGIYKNINFEYPIIENHFNGIYRYSTGSFNTYKEAEAYAHKLQGRGVFDAFVVAYQNNERISITQAMKK